MNTLQLYIYNVMLSCNMKTKKEAVELLQCHPGSISRFVNQGKLTEIKNVLPDGRIKFYTDESIEKLMLLREPVIAKAKAIKKYQKKISKKNESFELNEIGNSIMSSTIEELKSLGIYRKNDNYAIFDYAMFYQISMNTVGIASQHVIDGASVSVNPDIKIALAISRLLDMKRQSLGLNPAARERITIKEKELMDEMGGLVNG